MGRICEYMGLFCEYMGLFCEYMGLFCEYMGLFYEFMRLSLKNIELLGGYSGRTHLFTDIQKAFSLSLALSLYVRSSVRGTFGKLLC